MYKFITVLIDSDRMLCLLFRLYLTWIQISFTNEIKIVDVLIVLILNEKYAAVSGQKIIWRYQKNHYKANWSLVWQLRFVQRKRSE